MKWLVALIVTVSLAGCGGKQSVSATGSGSRTAEKAAGSGRSAWGVLPGGTAVSVLEFPGFRVEVDELRLLEDGSVVVGLQYTCKYKDGMAVGLPPRVADLTLLLDDVGNRYKLTKWLGTNASERSKEWQNIPAGSRGSISLVFEVISKSEKKPSLFDLTTPHLFYFWYSGRQNYNFQFRGIQPR